MHGQLPCCCIGFGPQLCRCSILGLFVLGGGGQSDKGGEALPSWDQYTQDPGILQPQRPGTGVVKGPQNNIRHTIISHTKIILGVILKRGGGVQTLFGMRRRQKNSIAFDKAPQREADSQPISQSVRQAVSQAVSRASRQADWHAEIHGLGFSTCKLHLQTLGQPS